MQTLLDRSYQQSLAIANQLATDPNYAHQKINTLTGARIFLPTIEALQSHFSEQVRTEAADLVKVIAPFCNQHKFDDLHEFLKENNFNKRNLFNTIFLNKLGLKPESLYAEEYCGKSWDTMTSTERCPYLDSFAFRASYQVCYKLSESPWHPSKPISSLISGLETLGPHYVKGMFGKSFYQSEPLVMKDKVKDRTVWYWPTGAERKELGKSHSIVIVGAREGGSSGGLVYFVDPLDGSDPSNPEQQKIYAMSYNRLRESIINLKQQRTFSADDGSPVYLDEVNYALYKGKEDPTVNSFLQSSSPQIMMQRNQ